MINRNIIDIRIADIDSFVSFVEFVDDIEAYKHRPLQSPTSTKTHIISSDLQNTHKALSLLLLYNLVEFMIEESLYMLYDALVDNNVRYNDVTSQLQKLWDNYKEKDNSSLKHEWSVENPILFFDKIPFKISGNIDMRKIRDIFKKHGIDIDETKCSKAGNSFLIVKNKRNNLAHGNVSFSECGALYTMTDIYTIKEDVVSLSKYLFEQVILFFQEEKYRCATVRKELCASALENPLPPHVQMI